MGGVGSSILQLSNRKNPRALQIETPAGKYNTDGGFLPVFARRAVFFRFLGHSIPPIAELAVTANRRVRGANRPGNGGLRTESNHWEHLPLFLTGSRNAPFRSRSVLHPPYLELAMTAVGKVTIKAYSGEIRCSEKETRART